MRGLLMATICLVLPIAAQAQNNLTFSEEELRVLHAGLVKMSILDQDVSNEARESVERILDKIEDIIPELREQEMEFDFDMEFGQQEEMEIGG